LQVKNKGGRKQKKRKEKKRNKTTEKKQKKGDWLQDKREDTGMDICR